LANKFARKTTASLNRTPLPSIEPEASASNAFFIAAQVYCGPRSQTVRSITQARQRKWYSATPSPPMFRVASARLRFIEPQLPSQVDQPPEGSTGLTKSNTMAIAANYFLSVARRVFLPATGSIGATDFPLSSAPLPTSVADGQLSMVRPSFRTVTALLTSRHYAPRCCGDSPRASSSVPSILCTSTATASDNNALRASRPLEGSNRNHRCGKPHPV
jgi:hypothetical protein